MTPLLQPREVSAPGTLGRPFRLMFFISEDFYFLSHRKELLLGLQSRGFDVSLVTRLAADRRETEATGLRIHNVDLDRKSLSAFKLARQSWHYVRLIRQHKPDLLVPVALKPIVLAAVAGMLTKTPILCVFAGLGVAFARHTRSLKLWAARHALETCFQGLLTNSRTYCLFQHEEDRSHFVSRNWTTRERSWVISGAGVNLAQFTTKKWESGKVVRFLFVGRLLWDKGIRFLVEACRELQARGVRFECWIAGLIDSANPSAVPVSYIEEQHVAGVIRWLGPQKNVPGLLIQADCLVFPSVYREGVPRVLLEASAAGIPIITSDSVGCREVVQNEWNGLLVSPGDPRALADAMERIAVGRVDIRKMGLNARKRAEELYQTQTVLDEHIRLLLTIAAEQRLPVEGRRSTHPERRLFDDQDATQD